MGLPFYGSAVYTLEQNGDLYGFFTNIGAGGKAFREIATRKHDKGTIEGLYSTSYTDFDSSRYTGDLVITREEGLYILNWTIIARDDNPISLFFSGLGHMSGCDQLIVSYRKVETLPIDHAISWRSRTPIFHNPSDSRPTIIIRRQIKVTQKT